MTTKYVYATSRTGATFGCATDIEGDGAFTVLSSYGHGYRSAHRDLAAAHHGTRSLWCMNRLSWINDSGVRVVLTRWQPLSVWSRRHD